MGVQFYADILNQILVLGVFAVSLNLLIGFGGQLSVAHASLGAVGGYTAAYLAVAHGAHLYETLPLGILTSAIVGGLLGLFAQGLTDEYVILLTLSGSIIIVTAVTASSALGSTYGLVGVPNATVDGAVLQTPLATLPVTGFCLLVVYLICERIGRSSYGRSMRAVGENGISARALGKSAWKVKTSAFIVTSGMAGLAGVLLVYYDRVSSPGMFGFDQSVAMFAVVVIGGIRNLWGSIIGAAVITALTPFLQHVVNLEPSTASLIQLIVYGCLLVIIVLLRPQGLFHRKSQTGEGQADEELLASKRLNELATQARERSDPVSTGVVRAENGPGDIAVRAEGLSKAYQGIQAVSDLSLPLEHGVITALVGPNGAGKTTIFNLLTGVTRADTGRVFLGDRLVTGLSPNQIAGLGMVRTFQDLRIFEGLSVLENVLVAVPGQQGEKLVSLFSRPRRVSRAENDALDTARTWLEFVGLNPDSSRPVAELSYGQRKLIVLARALATGASVLLLDEPAAGLEYRWADAMVEVVRQVRSLGKTICIVEHNLHVVRKLADTIYFMETGRITAQGSFDELVQDPRLADVYFGRNEVTAS